MAEFFGRESKVAGYNNRNNAYRQNAFNPNFKAKRNCCGLAATGDEDMPITDLPVEALPPETSATPPPVNSSVQSMQTWQYAKTGLALVGAWVVAKWLFSKLG